MTEVCLLLFTIFRDRRSPLSVLEFLLLLPEDSCCLRRLVRMNLSRCFLLNQHMEIHGQRFISSDHRHRLQIRSFHAFLPFPAETWLYSRLSTTAALVFPISCIQLSAP